MKILVLNGSPKGKKSITLQYVNYIQKKFHTHNYEVENISQRIKRIEKDESVFQEIIKKVENADAIIWAVPLYVCLVPSQYKRFIELIWEHKVNSVFKNKYTAVITTSIHFYDHTANNYMRAICEDLEMKYIDYMSSHMYSLLQEEGREKIIKFASNFFDTIENQAHVSRQYYPVKKSDFIYKAKTVEQKISCKGEKILIVTDYINKNSNSSKMLTQFKSNFVEDIEVINLHELDIKGACLGCIQCGYDYTCQYNGRDKFTEFYRTKIMTADILVFVGTITDRFLSAHWKMFFDRTFFNTHTPTMITKQVLYVISGPLSQIPNISEIFLALAQIQKSNLMDFVTDESENSENIDKLIAVSSQKVISFSKQKIVREHDFLGVGGMKIFRDDIYGPLRFPFIADYKAYKKLGIMKFPHRKIKYRIYNALMFTLSKIPKVREKIYKTKLIPGMVDSLKKIVETK